MSAVSVPADWLELQSQWVGCHIRCRVQPPVPVLGTHAQGELSAWIWKSPAATPVWESPHDAKAVPRPRHRHCALFHQVTGRVYQWPKPIKPWSDFFTSFLHIYNHVSNVEYTFMIKTKLGLNTASEACQGFLVGRIQLSWLEAMVTAWQTGLYSLGGIEMGRSKTHSTLCLLAVEIVSRKAENILQLKRK